MHKCFECRRKVDGVVTMGMVWFLYIENRAFGRVEFSCQLSSDPRDWLKKMARL